MHKSEASSALSSEEISVVSQMVSRAVASDQMTELFTKIFNDNPDLLAEIKKEFANLPSGSMRDGSKRRYEAVNDVQSDVSPSSTNWSLLNSLRAHRPDEPLTLRQALPNVQIKEDKKIPLPSDVKDIDDWSTTKLKMEKYKDKGWRYSDLLEKSQEDKEVKKYLNFILKSYGKDVNSPCENQATDLARFLLRMNWSECQGEVCGYRRER